MELRRLLILSLALTAAACGNKTPASSNGENPQEAFSPQFSDGQTLYLDSDSISEGHRASLSADLSRIKELRLNDPQGSLADMLGIPAVSAEQLNRWLRIRTRAIVGEGFRSHLYSVIDGETYQPEIFDSGSARTDEQAIILMSNIGSAIYRLGKERSKVFGIDLAGQKVLITSPRAGILQLGDGLFSHYRISSSDIDAQANSFLRIGVLFHEARHSDGHGDHVGFPHVTCTDPDSPYFGRKFCDDYVNGAYGLEARLLERLLAACDTCNAKERDVLEILHEDAWSRINRPENRKTADPKPEKISPR